MTTPLTPLDNDSYPEPVHNGPLTAKIMATLNQAIAHITTLETEVEKLKKHTHTTKAVDASAEKMNQLVREAVTVDSVVGDALAELRQRVAKL